MPTVYSRPEQLGHQMRECGQALIEGGDATLAIGRLVEQLQAQGETPDTIETRVNNLLEASDALMRRIGAELGDESTAPLIASAWAKEYRRNSPSGLKHFDLGVKPDYHYDNRYETLMPRSVMLYNDAASIADIWDDFAAGSVLSVRGSRKQELNGNYTLRYAVDAKGSSGNPAAAATYGPNNGTDGFWEGDFRNDTGEAWTEGTGWSQGSNKASYNHASSNAALTHALAGMTADSFYMIEFGLTYDNSGTGDLKVDIGGDFYWERTGISSTSFNGRYVLYTNAPSATPTLSFTPTVTDGTFQISIDHVNVYGVPGVMVEEEFSRNFKDDMAVVALERIP